MTQILTYLDGSHHGTRSFASLEISLAFLFARNSSAPTVPLFYTSFRNIIKRSLENKYVTVTVVQTTSVNYRNALQSGNLSLLFGLKDGPFDFWGCAFLTMLDIFYACLIVSARYFFRNVARSRFFFKSQQAKIA